jgi:hypothetical protein
MLQLAQDPKNALAMKTESTMESANRDFTIFSFS